jgi:IS605 OrfB family transposase
LLSINTAQQIAKITTCSKRVAIPYLCSREHSEILCQASIKQSKLFLKDKAFYLQLCVEIQDEELLNPIGVIGVDFGICNIATTNTGEVFSGEPITKQRKRYKNQRASLQQKHTRSTKRKLRKTSGKEMRFVRNTNHIISKALVKQAFQEQKALAIEDLNGIRKKRENSFIDTGLHSWTFHQLRSFIEYKSKLYTVPLVIVNPKYTSQECNVCGYTHKENRKSQSEFLCKQCGHYEHADVNAAKNIAKRAALSIGLLSSDSDKDYQSRLKDKLTALAVSY